MKLFAHVLCTFLLTISFSGQLLADAPPKVLMVLSGYGETGSDTRPGYEFEEYADAYLVFEQNGIAIDVASPNGGAVDPDQYDPNTHNNAIILANPEAMAKLDKTLPLSGLKAANYASIFVVGGKGAMFDLPDNSALQTLIANIYEGGGVVSAVCHGPAALTNVQLSSGKYLVKGKAVNSFTNTEEELFGQKWIPHFDFMLEDKLKERGAVFQHSPIMLSHVAVDGRLITGQNPSSTADVAEAVVRALGIDPAPRELTEDQRTLVLISNIVAGKENATTEFANSKQGFNNRLIATYGYFYADAAATDSDRRVALTLMNLVPELHESPKLVLQIAKSHLSLNEVSAAEALLASIRVKHPDFEPAKQLLETL